jgi:hypothetical protein
LIFKVRRQVCNIFSIFPQSFRYEEFLINNFKILYCPNITHLFSKFCGYDNWPAKVKFWDRSPVQLMTLFSIYMLRYPTQLYTVCTLFATKCEDYSIIYLVKYLCFACANNIIDLVQVNWMQNVTKYVLLRNLASVLNFTLMLITDWQLHYLKCVMTKCNRQLSVSPLPPVYVVYISQLIWYARACSTKISKLSTGV